MENVDWNNLGFTYRKTPYNIRCEFKDGKWGKLEVHTEDTITMSIAANCLHYGQEAFEGLKAFRMGNGDIGVFRMDENAKRMIKSADCLKMAAPSIEMFCEAVKECVSLNKDFVPPVGTNASLYIRPVLFGTTAQVGVNPAKDFTFIVFVTPVGAYFGGIKPFSAIVLRGFDRAAPLGTGGIKAGGNYAASLYSLVEGHDKGYGGVIYLDPKEKKYIDECGAANVIAIKGNKYITPTSSSILCSITNMSLQTIAEDMGLEVERRKVAFDEVDSFDEMAACGTAAVLSPIGKIFDADNNKTYNFGDEAGAWSKKLYDRLVGIQYGTQEDKFGWMTIIK